MTQGQILRANSSNAYVASTATYPDTAGTSGNVLTSDGTNWSSAAPAAGGVTTLTGTTGGAISPSAGNINLLTTDSGATVSFDGSGSTQTLHLMNTTTHCMGLGVGAGGAGNYSVYIGWNCGAVCTTDNNVFVGPFSFNANTSGQLNVGVGPNALGQNVSGNGNTCLGHVSGYGYTGSESYNICIGANTLGTAGESNTLRIGSATGTGTYEINQTFIQGINGSTVTGTAVLCASDGQLGTVVSSKRYKENIKEISRNVSIMNLRPVEFNYKSDGKKTVQYGLVAEEVEKDFPYLCFYKDGQPESVKYHEIPVLLLKEIQRLNDRISALEKR